MIEKDEVQQEEQKSDGKSTTDALRMLITFFMFKRLTEDRAEEESQSSK
jgi:hypothetical protein